jgi:inhibitor of Bruton tyrosine kinase
VTKSGEVLSWGLNRFSQLGYVIEPTSTGNGVSLGRSEEPIQASPRKIFGPLKKGFVVGVAACKTASACWTDDEVFTWGTNHGQLGEIVFLACFVLEVG